MRVAFDLDDTLIPCARHFPVERPTLLARCLGCEPLRAGTVALCRQLRARGCELWVYTTSCRNPWSVRLQFLSYRLRLGGVVNYDRHRRWLDRLRGERNPGWPDPAGCSKFPPAFGVHLLVDDSEGVVLEGQRFGFRVLHVRQDPDWADAVLAAVGGA
jgi:hypothetical protein